MFKNTIFSIIFVSSKFVVFEHRTSPEWRLWVLYKIMSSFLNKTVAIIESQIVEKYRLCITCFIFAISLHAESERR